MSTNVCGWSGKILKVNLANREVVTLDTMEYADRFLGGRGIATRIYWEEVGPEVGALDPENRLILMTGPLEATGAQGAARFELVSKSPMLRPEGFCYGNIGGFFGSSLKRSGYDGIVLFGRSVRPVYLWIGDDKVQLLDASDLWGKGVHAVRDFLKERHGKNCRYVTTGVAGENLCRSANLLTDNDGSVTGGFGAVMGSKNLKAIAVLGRVSPSVARPEELKELNHLAVHLSKNEPMPLPFPQEQVRRTGTASCYQCGLTCNYRNILQTASGKSLIRKCQAMFVYLPWVMGRKGESTETALDATGICNELSLCTMEMFNIIQWLIACNKSGYLTDRETGIDFAKLGTLEFFEGLATMIAHRQGFGDLLAEGLLRVGDKLGPEARGHFSQEVSGVGSGATYSGREYLMNGLLYAFEPRQPIAMLHEASRLVGLWVINKTHPGASPVTSEVFRAAARKFWGHDQAWDLMVPEGKAVAAARIMERTIVKDSLLLCDANWPLMVSWNTLDHLGDPSLESRIFSAVTGIDTDEAALNRYGERIFNLQRGILLREGWQPKKDDLPAEFNFTVPVETVFMNPEVIVPGPQDEVISRKGRILGRDEYEKMRREFYEFRGWNQESGLQKTETLERLQLKDVAEDLGRIGLVNG
jgi:aldehyde:ferredoxin oxidoreductase